MAAPRLPADQQFFADLLSGVVLNPQRLGRVWFAGSAKSCLREAYVSISRVLISFCAASTAMPLSPNNSI